MEKTNYANAYTEVLVILNNLIKEDYDKIPKEYIDFLTVNYNKDYEFHYDYSKTFEQQEILDDTKYILFGLFEKFGATETQKDMIRAFKTNYYNKIEDEKRKKYNPDNIFYTNKDKSNIENNSNALTIEYKESLFEKIKKTIFKLFHIEK